VASDELNEPFETVLYARRESSFSETLEQQEHARWSARNTKPQALGDLLVTPLGTPCSSKNLWWRWRESNPRPSVPHQGFSGRSLR
jgi:hypothetical protein